MLQKEIAAIETRHSGHRFRSRLEARWAVFFESLGIPYAYEPQTFDLGEAGWYLPDFYLPTLGGLYVEIKPELADNAKVTGFAETTGIGIALLGCHTVSNYVGELDGGHAIIGRGPFGEVGFDMPYLFCVCPRCGKVGFKWNAISSRIDCGCWVNQKNDIGCQSAIGSCERIDAAVEAARSARFGS